MEKQIRESDFVLLIFTETYYKRVTDNESLGVGKGVNFETYLTYQQIYENNSMNEKYIPVVFKPADLKFIPESLRGFQSYVVDVKNISADRGYDELYRRLTKMPLIMKPELGESQNLSVGVNLESDVLNLVDSDSSQEAHGQKNLISGGIAIDEGEIYIEIKIAGDYSKFTEADKNRFLRAVSEFLEMEEGNLVVTKIRDGSILITLKLPPDKAERLRLGIKAGRFEEYSVIDGELKEESQAVEEESKTKSDSRICFSIHRGHPSGGACSYWSSIQSMPPFRR